MVTHFNEIAVFERGLVYAGFQGRRLQRMQLGSVTAQQRFKGLYGSSAKVLSVMFTDLQTKNIAAARIHVTPNNAENMQKKFMMTHYYLKTYPTFESLSGAKECSEKTGAMQTNFFISKFKALKPQKGNNTEKCIFLFTPYLLFF